MQKNRSQGFTLIELLVVIAIIGILSAVVLASLNTARSKGNDAAIQSNLATIQVQAEVFYGTDNSYDGVCADANVVKALAAATAANGGTAAVCNDASGAYAASAQLSSDATRNWCVDSTGANSKSTTDLEAATVCPASN